MPDQIHRHPLAALRAGLGLSATQYLVRLAARHRALGYGTMSIRREKIARWESGTSKPSRTAALAIADLHGVPLTELQRREWPHWLHRAFSADRMVLDAPWTAAGTLQAIAAAATRIVTDHRAYPLITGPLVEELLGRWQAAGSHDLRSPGRRLPAIHPALLDRLVERTAELGWLRPIIDADQLGSLAVSDLRLLRHLAGSVGCDRDAGRTLLRSMTTTALVASWSYAATGRIAPAQLAAVTALRAATGCDDRVSCREALTALATQAYDTGHVAAGRRLADAAASVDAPVLRSISPLDHPRGPIVDVPRLHVSTLAATVDAGSSRTNRAS